MKMLGEKVPLVVQFIHTTFSQVFSDVYNIAW